VALVKLLSLSVREALHVDRGREQIAKREHIRQSRPAAVETLRHLIEV